MFWAMLAEPMVTTPDFAPVEVNARALEMNPPIVRSALVGLDTSIPAMDIVIGPINLTVGGLEWSMCGLIGGTIWRDC